MSAESSQFKQEKLPQVMKSTCDIPCIEMNKHGMSVLKFL